MTNLNASNTDLVHFKLVSHLGSRTSFPAWKGFLFQSLNALLAFQRFFLLFSFFLKFLKGAVRRIFLNFSYLIELTKIYKAVLFILFKNYFFLAKLLYLRTVRKRLIIDVTIDTTHVQQSEIKLIKLIYISSFLLLELLLQLTAEQ